MGSCEHRNNPRAKFSDPTRIGPEAVGIMCVKKYKDLKPQHIGWLPRLIHYDFRHDTRRHPQRQARRSSSRNARTPCLQLEASCWLYPPSLLLSPLLPVLSLVISHVDAIDSINCIINVDSIWIYCNFILSTCIYSIPISLRVKAELCFYNHIPSTDCRLTISIYHSSGWHRQRPNLRNVPRSVSTTW